MSAFYSRCAAGFTRVYLYLGITLFYFRPVWQFYHEFTVDHFYFYVLTQFLNFEGIYLFLTSLPTFLKDVLHYDIKSVSLSFFVL